MKVSTFTVPMRGQGKRSVDQWRWVGIDGEPWIAMLSFTGVHAIVRTEEGEYDLVYMSSDGEEYETPEIIAHGQSVEALGQKAVARQDKIGRDTISVLKHSRWHDLPPTSGQKYYLESMGADEIPETRIEASTIISLYKVRDEIDAMYGDDTSDLFNINHYREEQPE